MGSSSLNPSSGRLGLINLLRAQFTGEGQVAPAEGEGMKQRC